MGEIRVLDAGRQHPRLAVRPPAELDVLQAFADPDTRLEDGQRPLGGVRIRPEDIHTVRRLVGAIDDELIFAVAVDVHGQGPSPEADAEIHDESGVVIFQTFQAGLPGCIGCRLRPGRTLHRPGDDLRRVYDHMFGELTLPRVGDVDESVRRLDDGRVAEFSLGLVFEDHRGLPGDTILADGEVQRAAPLGGMVINDEVPAVLQGDGVRARVRIGQVDELDLRPRGALVFRERAEHLGITGPTDRQERTILQEKDARLDGGGVFRPLVDGDALPGDPIIAASLEINLPRGSDLEAFGAAAGEDRPVLQLHGFVLDRAEDAIRQTSRLAPGLAVVLAEAQHAPPFDRIGAHLVVKLQRAFLGLEEHGIPTRKPFAVGLDTFGYHHGRRPLAVDLPRYPDGNVRLALGFSCKPCRDQCTILRLDDRRGMTARHGVRLEDELRTDQTRLGAEESHAGDE